MVSTLESVEVDETEETVYNFRVFELQNYAVGTCGVLVHNTKNETPNAPNPRTTIEEFADSVQGLPGKQRPGAVSRLYDGPEGEFLGQAQKGTDALDHHPVVAEVLKDIPPDPLSPGQLGRCAEVDATNQALRAYENRTRTQITTLEQAREVLRGSKMQTANVRGLGGAPGIHGTPKIPCTVCDPFLGKFGIKYQ